jgi:hypothetical protein
LVARSAGSCSGMVCRGIFMRSEGFIVRLLDVSY